LRSHCWRILRAPNYDAEALRVATSLLAAWRFLTLRCRPFLQALRRLHMLCSRKPVAGMVGAGFDRTAPRCWWQSPQYSGLATAVHSSCRWPSSTRSLLSFWQQDHPKTRLLALSPGSSSSRFSEFKSLPAISAHMTALGLTALVACFAPKPKLFRRFP
jgi:hypothetical protein